MPHLPNPAIVMDAGCEQTEADPNISDGKQRFRKWRIYAQVEPQRDHESHKRIGFPFLESKEANSFSGICNDAADVLASQFGKSEPVDSRSKNGTCQDYQKQHCPVEQFQPACGGDGDQHNSNARPHQAGGQLKPNLFDSRVEFTERVSHSEPIRCPRRVKSLRPAYTAMQI